MQWHRAKPSANSKAVAVVGLAIGLFLISSPFYADSFVVQQSPTQPYGNQGEEAFKDPEDPQVCNVYLRNLRHFARLNTPMSCERPVAPQFRKLIQAVAWEDLNPREYPDLFRGVLAEFHYWKTNPPKDESRELAWSADELKERGVVFRRAKAKLSANSNNF